MDPAAPTIQSAEADEAFRARAVELGFKVDESFLGDYVDYEWRKGRYLFQRFKEYTSGDRSILEFGCFVGGSAIVMAILGARITGIDIDAAAVDLAAFNAARYGVSDRVSFAHVSDTTKLPFENEQFDCVTCNSVLEYVSHGDLPGVLAEIHRVLKPGGAVLITGTSNRLWPREIHSGSWTNYVPRGLDTALGKTPRRGKFPWELLSGFPNYENLDRSDRGKGFIEMKSWMGVGSSRLALLRTAGALLSPLGLTVGMLTPSMALSLRKR